MSLAEDSYRALARRFPAREAGAIALWRVGWLSYLRGDAGAAALSWTHLTEMPGGRAHRLAALYWTGRAKDQLGAREAAQRAYQRVLERGATQLLRALGRAPPGRLTRGRSRSR